MDLNVMKNNTPNVYYNSKQLDRNEMKLSKFFKCLPNEEDICFWTGNKAQKFRQHLNKHKSVFCFYCKFDEIKESFDDKHYDQLIEHLVQKHGFRCFQCNLCVYRAITSTHIHLHQISAHYLNWSNNNLVENFDSFKNSNNDMVSKICKIIICKKLCLSESIDHSVYMKKFAPQLDPNISQYHCLFCDFKDEEITHVFIHCIQNHSDYQISVWHKKKDKINLVPFQSNDSSKLIQYNCDNNSSNSMTALRKPLSKWTKTISNKSKPKTIPGLEANFKAPPERQSYEPFDDDYCETPMDVSDNEQHSQQRVTFNRSQTYEKRRSQMAANRGLNRNRYFNNNNINNQNERPLKRPSSNSQESAVKRINNQRTPPELVPTPSRSIPPPIDLESIEPEISEALNSSQNKRVNTFKNNHKRVAHTKSVPQNSPKKNANKVSYIKRVEKERDEYIELINETESHVPKKGLKARFENRSFFEPTAISSNKLNFNEKNIFKCLICKIDNLRNKSQIANHLSTKHNTNSSLKCGFCEFIGQRHEILEHSKLMHCTSEAKVEKFIVDKNQDKAIGITSTSRVERPVVQMQATARKRTGGTVPLPRGALSQRIKESTFMGPLKNDKTIKKRQLEYDQTVRVKSRTPHSSNIKPKQVSSPCVARKSTSKGSQPQKTLILTQEEIPAKYFCVFCSDSYIINNKADAIEHYKNHLELGYKCAKCSTFVISYDQMVYHFESVHENDEIDFEDNMTPSMTKWISNFLDNQIKNSLFVEEDIPSDSCGISIECPLCAKASVICKKKSRRFSILWQLKLHLCKHLLWLPMKCLLCEENDIMYPKNNYLLMKHLVEEHFRSPDNLYNQSFRGQKAYNDMKADQLRAIDRHYDQLRVDSSDKIDAFFQQLNDDFDIDYENQLKTKFGLNKEIQINLERTVCVKSEPIDDQNMGCDEDIEDKKDIKTLIKTEFKTETKSEIKTEIKPEVKEEVKAEPKSNLHLLFGEDNEFIPHSSRKPVTIYDSDIECLTLSSDEES